MLPNRIVQETELSEREMADRVAFTALAFRNNPISRFQLGDLYEENPALWLAFAENDLRKALKIGRVYTTQSETGEILAIAVTLDAGRNYGDLPNSEEVDEFLAAMPEEQKAFKAEYVSKQTAAYMATYPSDVRKENAYLDKFAVKDGLRGQGIGSSLLQRVISDIASEGYRLIIDTSTPMNVSFYQRNGVKLNGQFEIAHYKHGPLPRSFMLATE